MSCTILQDGNLFAPILLWLQGGPGGSSLFGLFNEGGPFLVDKDGNLKDKPWTWNSKYHMIFIDNPVSVSTCSRHSLCMNAPDSCRHSISNASKHFFVHRYKFLGNLNVLLKASKLLASHFNQIMSWSATM